MVSFVLMSTSKTSILFLCTGNSARSIMAEAIVGHEFGDRLRASSAGSRPADEVNPLALETLRKYGIDTEGLQPKSWDDFRDRAFDLVITLCDASRQESCPGLPGGAPHAHWSLPDPPAADHPQDMFEAVYDALVEGLGLLAYGPSPSVADLAAEAGRALNRRFAPRAI